MPGGNLNADVRDIDLGMNWDIEVDCDKVSLISIALKSQALPVTAKVTLTTSQARQLSLILEKLADSLERV